MSERRAVVLSLPMIRSMTLLEFARAAAAARVALPDSERILRALYDRNPKTFADVERGAELVYAWAWQLVRRDEPDVTWTEAQTWAVTFDRDAVDDVAIAEAEARVRAAVLTGLSPAETDGLTMGELDVYAEIAGRGGG